MGQIKTAIQRAAMRISEDRWRAANQDTIRNKWLFKKYGIALWEYKAMFKNQNGCCAICEKHQSKFKYSLAVDHCHTTGAVRGLLCIKCNRAIGLLNDDPKLVGKALGYLHGPN